MNWPTLVFIGFAVLLGFLLWIYEHPPKNRGKQTGRGGDFEE
jgi:hypothetical protein